VQYYQTHTFGQTQAQGQIMPEPPMVLSTKDHLYLKDAMSWLLTAIKKCRHFAQECNDSDVKQVLDKTGRMHQMHYQMLLNHLQPMQQQQLLQQYAQRQQQQQQQQQFQAQAQQGQQFMAQQQAPNFGQNFAS